MRSRSAMVITCTGRVVDAWNVTPADVHPSTIAIALAKQCRYAGHTNTHYSVAEHCVLMARYATRLRLPRVTIQWALLHDATEAWLPDIPSPIKRLLPELRAAEDRAAAAVQARFGLEVSPAVAAWVHDIDKQIVFDELRALIPAADVPSGSGLGVRIEGWSAHRAEINWLRTLQALGLSGNIASEAA